MTTDSAHEDRIGWFGRAWVAAVFGYSILRAVVVWPTLGTYGVNPWVFLVIDVLTAWPYAVGQVRVVQGLRRKNWKKVESWGIVTLLSFLAPYAYIVLAGSGEMPALAYAVVGLLVVVIGAAAVMRIIRQARVPEATA